MIATHGRLSNAQMHYQLSPSKHINDQIAINNQN